MSDPWKKDVEDARMEIGVGIAKAREEWRDELRLELKSFRNEMRVLMVMAFAVLGFDLPSELTAVAIGGVALKAAATRFLN